MDDSAMQDSASESGGPLLAPEAFVRLREWGGDELVRKMIELFIENSPQRMEQIRTGIADQDADRLERGAHSLKSSCGNLGAESVRSLAARIERFAETGDTDSAAGLLDELEARYDRTLAALVQARDRGTVDTGGADE